MDTSLQNHSKSNMVRVTERVVYRGITPTALEEQLVFDVEHPHRVSIRGFPNDDIAPLHYSSTLEIALAENLVGEFVVNGQVLNLDKNIVIVVPPGVLHSSHVKRCDGFFYNLKISPEHLNHYINLENILCFRGLSIDNFAFTCGEFDRVKELIMELIKLDGDIFGRMQTLLAIVEILSLCTRQAGPSVAPTNYMYESHQSLKKLIDWTQENYFRRIELDEAAKLVGFSKSHFCLWFKSLTNMTYANYSNHVRILKSCQLLQLGYSVAACADACGFESASNYIQCFKRIQGCTPKSYMNTSAKE